jgi:site-specific recombinase XerD
MSYPADPPRVEEIIAVMRQAGEDRYGLRVRAVIAVLYRGGLRISEALALTETDIDAARGSVLVRHGKGDRRREVGMDDWGLEHLGCWLTHPRDGRSRHRPKRPVERRRSYLDERRGVSFFAPM